MTKLLTKTGRRRLAVQQLVLDHMGLVESTAKRAAKVLPSCVEMDELCSIGYVALCERASKYDAKLHPSFRHYARERIWGAMIDAYRGANYPRRFASVPPGWLGFDADYDGIFYARERGDYSQTAVPDALRDKAPLADVRMIVEQDEEALVVCITEARRQLTNEEGRVIDRHLEGLSLREVGETEGKSAAWACLKVNLAKHKLREHLREHLHDENLKAA